VTIDWEILVKYLHNIGRSLAHHGFDKLLFVNGHGSNHHLVQHAARQITINYPETHAGMLSWWDIQEVNDVAAEVLEAGPEGSSHGGESETSIYMYLHPDDVEMDKSARDINYPDNKVIYNYGLTGGKRHEGHSQVNMMEWWSTFSETGTRGDATVATPEKGEALLEAAVDGLDVVVGEFKRYPVRSIDDKHDREVTDSDYDHFR
jgi:creatinine amidohydrolase